MKKIICMLALLSAAGVASSAVSKRVGDFSLLDSQGYFHQLSYYDDHQAVALLVQGNGSKATAKAIGPFKDAKAKYDGKIKFFMINPYGTATRDSVQQDVAKYDTDIPVLMDDTQLVSEALEIGKTGEVILIRPGSTEILYRGPVGKHFDRAVEQVLANEPVTKASGRVSGDKVKYATTTRTHGKKVSYSKDVAPILAENCARCHRERGIAPFAMNSHTIVRGFAPMIREVVLTKRMPPGQIDPHVGEFRETYTLTPQETQKLVHWIEAGAQKDGDIDPLTRLQWPASKWAFGEPDLIVKVPPQDIPATGVLDYIRVEVPIELDRDRWVRASQYLAGDRTVLHHTLNDLIGPGQKAAGFLAGGDPDQARITAYIPGAQPQVEPANTGGLLKKGSKLALQLHYTTNGRVTTDASEIGLWFYPDDQVPAERMTSQCACIFTRGWDPIPPFDPDHEIQQTITIAKDAYIYSMLPHMHFRGKRMRFYAEYPDGGKEELLNIAKYNYNWQLNYELKEPKLVPAGTKIRAVGAFDNSAQNKANPDPSREVPWGQQSWDEMFFGAVTYKYVDQGSAKVQLSQDNR